MSSAYKFATSFLVVVIVALMPTIDSHAQTVIAGYDFDDLFLNVTKAWGGGLDNRDGGPGNFFGIGNINNWPQSSGVPFSVIDESGSAFPTDVEGIMSDVESDRDNVFAVVSDTAEINPSNPNFIYNACWGFNVSSSTGPLVLSIDMGQCSDGASFDGFTDGYVLFEYQINGGGPWLTAFSCDPFDSTDSGFNYRNMDSGFDTVEAFVCQATGLSEIIKISAEDGLPSDNTILDKCPPTGSPGAGNLDTFITEIVGGEGANAVEVRIQTVLPFEAFVFDNIQIIQVPAVSVVSPTQVTPTRGDFVSGDVTDLDSSDNSDYSMRRRVADTQSRTEFEVKSISPTAAPTTFEFTLEGAVFARSNVVQTIELFDYDTASWELVSTSDAARSPAPDSVVTVAATGDLSRFVEAGTMCIAARVRFLSDNPRQRFASNTDQTVWTIGQ